MKGVVDVFFPATFSYATRRRFLILAVSMLSVLGMVVVAAAPAQADFNTELQNHATGACLFHTFARVRGVDCNNATGIVWTLRGWGDGTVQVSSLDRCLDDSRFGLRMIPCHAGSSPFSAHQSWYRTHGAGGYEYRNQATGWCLDDSRFGVRMFPCNGMEYQRWSEGRF